MTFTDQAAIAAAARIREKAGARVHRLGEDEETEQEAPMPTGVYERKRKAQATPAAESPPTPKKRGRKPGLKAPKAQRPQGSAIPRFGVFDDGSVSIIVPKFSGTLTAEEAAQFVGFLRKIGVKV